jgi:hypothetical protein
MNFQPDISTGMPTAPVTIAAGIEGKRRIGRTIIRRHLQSISCPSEGEARKRLHDENCANYFGIGKRNDSRVTRLSSRSHLLVRVDK